MLTVNEAGYKTNPQLAIHSQGEFCTDSPEFRFIETVIVAL